MGSFNFEIDWGDDEWPKECRCGFIAEDEEAALAHALFEHPESIT